MGQDLIGVYQFDLDVKTHRVQIEHGVVRAVRGRAEGVNDNNYPVAGVDRGQHSRENAHLGFGPGDDKRIPASVSQRCNAPPAKPEYTGLSTT